MTEFAPADLRGIGTVILVEGESDAAAVRTTAAALDADMTRVAVLPMGGATNILRYLSWLDHHDVVVRGMCDAREARGFRRALRHRGRDDDLTAAGFVVCHADLEDEYLRSLGAARVRAVVEDAGEGGRFATFANQPAQRGRSLDAQLHRFLGTQSGRKIRYGALLAQAAGSDRVPRPLRDVLPLN